jgi:hypothetical protein
VVTSTTQGLAIGSTISTTQQLAIGSRSLFCQVGSILSRLWRAQRICLDRTTTITLMCSIDF